MVVMNPMMCRVIPIFLGMATHRISPLPFGDCDICCPIDVNIHIKFKLYTRSNPKFPQILHLNDTRRFQASELDVKKPTVIFLHGWAENAPGNGPKAIRNAYLKRGDYNVILVDWAHLIASPWYPYGVHNTELMGSVLASFIKLLLWIGVDINDLHVIGFSLGAHAAGLAGKRLKVEGILLRRITGLDPAYPGFDPSTFGRLEKGEAAFVDVIHTNPGISGLPFSIGDVDFYPNPESAIQTGCTPIELVKYQQFDRFGSCSHNRAWHYYAESVINPYGFPATQCKQFTGVVPECEFEKDGYMGFAASPKMHGDMFLRTNPVKPYARNGP